MSYLGIFGLEFGVLEIALLPSVFAKLKILKFETKNT